MTFHCYLLLLSALLPFTPSPPEGVYIGGPIDLRPYYVPVQQGYELMADHKYVAAETAFRNLSDRISPATRFTALADALLAQRRYTEAAPLYAERLQMDSGSLPAVQLRYAICLYALGNIKEARTIYSEVIPGIISKLEVGSSLLPTSFEVHKSSFRQFEASARIGAALSELANHTLEHMILAEIDADRALYLIPDSALAEYVLSKVILEKKPEAAISRLEKLLQSAPEPMKAELKEKMPFLRNEAMWIIKARKEQEKSASSSQ